MSPVTDRRYTTYGAVLPELPDPWDSTDPAHLRIAALRARASGHFVAWSVLEHLATQYDTDEGAPMC